MAGGRSCLVWAAMPTRRAKRWRQYIRPLGFRSRVPPTKKGVRYLLSTQKPDGTWFVVSRLHAPAPLCPPFVETGWPYGHDQFISAKGTSWAVSALLLAVPETPVAAPRLSWTATRPAETPDWAATVMFGKAADLTQMLDSGWDPTSATDNGTTALMMAAPDLDKTQLLLSRGADVNAKATKTRITALMVAASHHATGSVSLLLSNGAEAMPPKGSPARFGATPLFFAVLSGDVQAMEELQAKGADVEAKTLLFEFDPESPMSMAVFVGEPGIIDALIRHGAKFDLPDPNDGTTLLSIAIFRNDAAVVRQLIRAGADVNRRDKLGFTPLHWAANVEFGDTAVLEALLQAGADPAARNSDGVTPRELAAKYGHMGHQRVLAGADSERAVK